MFAEKIKIKNRNNLYLPSEIFIAQRLVGPSKQRKQIEDSIVWAENLNSALPI